MKARCLLAVSGLLLLVGCLPNPVSISRDGTIAFTLNEEGEYELIQDEGHQVYLTNVNADFFEKVEGMDDCRFPVISPSGRYIVACSGEDCAGKLILYDRETKKRKTIYRRRNDEVAVDFPLWSPDDRKIAFFEGDYEGPDFTLKVYDVKRRELEVLDRRAAPQATWLPDSKRLVYVSAPSGGIEGLEAPTYDLRMMNARSGRRKTLARGRLFAFSKIAVFPDGKAILVPCVNWEDARIGRGGIRAPFVLRKEILSEPEKKGGKRRPSEEEEEEIPEPEEAEAKPRAEEFSSPASEEEPEEEEFVLDEGQPFSPYWCAVSPDGKRIAYIRPLWETLRPVELQAAAEGETEGERTEEAEGEDGEPEIWEICVANADGSGGIAILQEPQEGGFFQVIWVSNTRLLCVTGEEILVVDADGKNKLDLIEETRKKFLGQAKEGDEAKNFTLPAGEGKTFNLSSFKGKKAVVLGIGSPYS